MNNES